MTRAAIRPPSPPRILLHRLDLPPALLRGRVGVRLADRLATPPAVFLAGVAGVGLGHWAVSLVVLAGCCSRGVVTPNSSSEMWTSALSPGPPGPWVRAVPGWDPAVAADCSSCSAMAFTLVRDAAPGRAAAG